MIFAHNAGRPSAGFSKPVEVTVTAGYQVPRILRALGILRYSATLAGRIDERRLIAPDSLEERAIRAATALACEELARHLDQPVAY